MLGIRRGSMCVERWMEVWTNEGVRGRGIEALRVRGEEGERNGSGRRLWEPKGPDGRWGRGRKHVCVERWM